MSLNVNSSDSEARICILICQCNADVVVPSLSVLCNLCVCRSQKKCRDSVNNGNTFYSHGGNKHYGDMLVVMTLSCVDADGLKQLEKTAFDRGQTDCISPTRDLHLDLSP